jgi:hypothetical protein
VSYSSANCDGSVDAIMNGRLYRVADHVQVGDFGSRPQYDMRTGLLRTRRYLLLQIYSIVLNCTDSGKLVKGENDPRAPSENLIATSDYLESSTRAGVYPVTYPSTS